MQIFLILPTFNVPYRAYNYGVGYIAAILKKRGHQVDYFILCHNKDTEKLYEIAKDKQPKLIGFSATSSQFNHLREISRNLKKISNPFIVCGGIHATLKPDCLKELPELDAIIRGEGEFAFNELADALTYRKEYRHIKNFWFRDPDKRNNIIKNDLRPPIKDLDALPLPDKDCLDYQAVINSCKSTNYFIFSRGCPNSCSYCSNKALRDLYKDLGPYFRLMSPERSIELIESDARKYDFKNIVFSDDIISINKDWFYKFFTLYKKNFSYPFLCNIHAYSIDADMIKMLKEAGATSVAIGIEHGNEEIRRKILKRKEKNQRLIEIVQCLRENGIKDNYGHILIGLPFENEELFLDTVRLSRRLGLNYFTYIFQPYPGTELGDLCEKEKWVPQEKFYYERRQAVIDYPNFSKEKIQICYDSFAFLARHKRLPLKIPLVKTIDLLKAYSALNKCRPLKSAYSLLKKLNPRIKKKA